MKSSLKILELARISELSEKLKALKEGEGEKVPDFMGVPFTHFIASDCAKLVKSLVKASRFKSSKAFTEKRLDRRDARIERSRANLEKVLEDYGLKPVLNRDTCSVSLVQKDGNVFHVFK